MSENNKKKIESFKKCNQTIALLSSDEPLSKISNELNQLLKKSNGSASPDTLQVKIMPGSNSASVGLLFDDSENKNANAAKELCGNYLLARAKLSMWMKKYDFSSPSIIEKLKDTTLNKEAADAYMKSAMDAILKVGEFSTYSSANCDYNSLVYLSVICGDDNIPDTFSKLIQDSRELNYKFVKLTNAYYKTFCDESDEIEVIRYVPEKCAAGNSRTFLENFEDSGILEREKKPAPVCVGQYCNI